MVPLIIIGYYCTSYFLNALRNIIIYQDHWWALGLGLPVIVGLWWCIIIAASHILSECHQGKGHHLVHHQIFQKSSKIFAIAFIYHAWLQHLFYGHCLDFHFSGWRFFISAYFHYLPCGHTAALAAPLILRWLICRYVDLKIRHMRSISRRPWEIWCLSIIII